MRRARMTIVGAGHVGATCAHWAAAKELADIVLVDVEEGTPQGKALDLFEAAPLERFDVNIVGSNGYDATAESDLAIIAAGAMLQPGMNREQLMEENVKIVAEAAVQIAGRSPDAVLLVVTSPVDATVHAAWKASGFPPARVLGQAGLLDAARYKAFIAQEIGCSVEDISALVMGGHATDMLPLPRYTSVGGIPVTQLIPAGKLDDIVTRTRNGGAEILGLLKTSNAYYAPAAAVVNLAESIIRDKRRILPCAAFCEKEYGVGGHFVAVPCVLGRNGVEKVVEVSLDEKERGVFNQSVERARTFCAAADKLLAKQPQG
jgi:malate dehydrogenase